MLYRKMKVAQEMTGTNKASPQIQWEVTGNLGNESKIEDIVRDLQELSEIVCDLRYAQNKQVKAICQTIYPLIIIHLKTI